MTDDEVREKALREFGIELPAIPDDVRHRCLEAIPRLRAFSDEILVRRGGIPIDIDGAMEEAREALLQANWETMTGTSSEVEAFLSGELEITPVSPEARQRALEALPKLRALREEILAERSGELIDVVAELREARAAHEGGE